VVGLPAALRRADEAALDDREAVLDLMMDDLARDNFIPEAMRDAFRTALWREVLRARGEDFSAFLSAVDVTIAASPGADRDRLAALLTEVLAHFELRPVFTFAAPAPDAPEPELLVAGQTVATGRLRRDQLMTAVRRSLSDW
jgi:hypothetical protein